MKLRYEHYIALVIAIFGTDFITKLDFQWYFFYPSFLIIWFLSLFFIEVYAKKFAEQNKTEVEKR